jgi:hypothetical protein
MHECMVYVNYVLLLDGSRLLVSNVPETGDCTAYITPVPPAQRPKLGIGQEVIAGHQIMHLDQGDYVIQWADTNRTSFALWRDFCNTPHILRTPWSVLDDKQV